MKSIFIIVFYFISIDFKVSALLTRIQKRRCEQLISLYENKKFQLQYNYVENIHNGMGYTCGRSAFTTSSGDAFEVVRRYTILVKNNPLSRYITELKLLSDRQSHDVSNLSGYPKAWRRAAIDPLFRQIQLDVSDDLYYRPAMILADKQNVRTGLGQCLFYDTVVKNGNGEDMDSIKQIIKNTEKLMDGSVDANEKEWLLMFLSVRQHILLNPHNPNLRWKWTEQIERIELFIQLIEMGNWQLIGPINIDTQIHSVIIS